MRELPRTRWRLKGPDACKSDLTELESKWLWTYLCHVTDGRLRRRRGVLADSRISKYVFHRFDVQHLFFRGLRNTCQRDRLAQCKPNKVRDDERVTHR